MNISWKQICTCKSHNTKHVWNTKTSQYHIAATPHYYRKTFCSYSYILVALYSINNLKFTKIRVSCVAASGPTIWTSTYALESTHCYRRIVILIEPSCWAQTVHMFTLRLYVSRDLTATSCAGCVFLLAFLRMYLRPRVVLHGPSFRVVSRAGCCLTEQSTVFCDMFFSSSW